MTVSILRTADAWWVHTRTGAARVSTAAATTRELLADRAAVEAAHSADTVPVESLQLPVPDHRAVPGGGTNGQLRLPRQRRRAGPQNRTRWPFFRKASGSISGPFRRYRQPITSGCSTMRWRSVWSLAARCLSAPRSTERPTSPDYVCGLVVTTTLSPRCATGPKRSSTNPSRIRRSLRSGPRWWCWTPYELNSDSATCGCGCRVNGAIRQDMLVDGDIIYPPVKALQALSRFQRLDAGDLVMTGTPVGTAISAPPKPIEIIGSLLPNRLKWKAFFATQAKNPKYLRHGDIIEAAVATMTEQSTSARNAPS